MFSSVCCCRYYNHSILLFRSADAILYIRYFRIFLLFCFIQLKSNGIRYLFLWVCSVFIIGWILDFNDLFKSFRFVRIPQLVIYVDVNCLVCSRLKMFRRENHIVTSIWMKETDWSNLIMYKWLKLTSHVLGIKNINYYGIFFFLTRCILSRRTMQSVIARRRKKRFFFFFFSCYSAESCCFVYLFKCVVVHFMNKTELWFNCSRFQMIMKRSHKTKLSPQIQSVVNKAKQFVIICMEYTIKQRTFEIDLFRST